MFQSSMVIVVLPIMVIIGVPLKDIWLVLKVGNILLTNIILYDINNIVKTFL